MIYPYKIDSVKSFEDYLKSEEYSQYYKEGEVAFLAGLPEDNPYHKIYGDTDGHSRYVIPWYIGYREIQKKTYREKYKLDEFHNEIESVIKKYGLTLDYTEEYGSPFVRTPEGYYVELA